MLIAPFPFETGRFKIDPVQLQLPWSQAIESQLLLGGVAVVLLPLLPTLLL
jgi:hypothetical protein